MADLKRKYVIEIDAETGNVIKGLESVEEAAEDAADAIEEVGEASDETSDKTGDAFGALDTLTGGAVSGLQNMIGSVKGVTTGMQAFKLALGPISLLLAAVGALVTWFKKTEEGQLALKRITAALGAVMGVLTDAVSAVGEALFNAFSKPQETVANLKDSFMGLGDTIKEYVMERVQMVIDGLGMLGSAIKKLFKGDLKGALSDAGQGFVSLNKGMNPVAMAAEAIVDGVQAASSAIGDLAQKASEAASKAADLEAQQYALAKAQLALNVETVKQREEISKLNMIADSAVEPIEDRIAATQQAFAIEADLQKQRVSNAEEELRIHQEQMALSESTFEDFEKEAELKQRVFELSKESLDMQVGLNSKLAGLMMEQQGILDARYALEQEMMMERLDGYEAEEQALLNAYDARVAAAGDDEGLIQMATENLQQALKELQEKYDEEARVKSEEELLLLQEAMATQEELEVQAINNKYARLMELAQQHGMSTVQLEKAREGELNNVRMAAMKAELDARTELMNKRVAVARQGMSILSNLNAAFAGESEKEQRRAFKRNKALQIAETTVATYANATSAYRSQIVVPEPTAPIRAGLAAGAAIAQGLAQIATIKKQKFTPSGGSTGGDGGGGGSAGGSVPSLGAAASQSTVPQLDTDTISQEGSVQTTMRAYVVEQELTTEQQKQQRLEEQARVA